MYKIQKFIQQLCYIASINLSILEVILLSFMAVMAWRIRRKHKSVPVVYSVFLILYIALLRREWGYEEIIRLHIEWVPSAGGMAGNFLNFLLYIPFGWAVSYWKVQTCRKISWWKTAAAGLLFSILCELTQYLTHRGWADVNDIVFNTIGTVAGIWLMKRFTVDR